MRIRKSIYKFYLLFSFLACSQVVTDYDDIMMTLPLVIVLGIPILSYIKTQTLGFDVQETRTGCIGSIKDLALGSEPHT